MNPISNHPFHDALTDKVLLKLNDSSKSLDDRINSAKKVLDKYALIPPQTLYTILDKFVLKSGYNLPETTLQKVIDECGNAILGSFRYQIKEKKQNHSLKNVHLYGSAFKHAIEYYNEGHHSLKINELPSTLELKPSLLAPWNEILADFKGKDKVASAFIMRTELLLRLGFEKFEKLCLSYCNETDEDNRDVLMTKLLLLKFSHPLKSATEIFKKCLTKNAPSIENLELEWILLQKGGKPQLDYTNVKDPNNSALNQVLKNINSILYPASTEDFEEDSDPITKEAFLQTAFLNRVSLPAKDLFLFVSLTSDMDILKKITEYLDNLLKTNPENRYILSLKLAYIFCNSLNSGTIRLSDFFFFLETSLKKERKMLEFEKKRILKYVCRKLDFEHNREWTDEIIQRFPNAKEFLDKTLQKTSKQRLQKTPEQVILEFCIGGTRENVDDDTKILRILKLLETHQKSIPVFLVQMMPQLNLSPENKACLAMFILGKIAKHKSIQDRKNMQILISFIDNKMGIFSLIKKNKEAFQIIFEVYPDCIEWIEPAGERKLLTQILEFYVKQKPTKLAKFYGRLLETEISVENEYYWKGPQAARLITSFFSNFESERLLKFLKIIEKGPNSPHKNELVRNLTKQLQWRFIETEEPAEKGSNR